MSSWRDRRIGNIFAYYLPGLNASVHKFDIILSEFAVDFILCDQRVLNINAWGNFGIKIRHYFAPCHSANSNISSKHTRTPYRLHTIYNYCKLFVFICCTSFSIECILHTIYIIIFIINTCICVRCAMNNCKCTHLMCISFNLFSK